MSTLPGFTPINPSDTARPGSMLEYQQRLLRRAPTANSTLVQESFVAVKLGRQDWLLDLSQVQEALAPPKMARISSAPRWVAGVVGVRGHVWSVIDMLALSPDEGVSTVRAASRGWMTLLRESSNNENQRIALLWSDMIEVTSKLDFIKTSAIQPSDAASLDKVEGELDQSLPPWTLALWKDGSGKVWKELDVSQVIGQDGLVDSWRLRAATPEV